MYIDSYQFGRIVVDGTAYDSDCLIVGDSVLPGWWRKQGHLLAPEDLQLIVAARPRILIVGCGAPGLMKVAEEARQVLRQQNIELVTLDTHAAVAKFNELAAKGDNVAAALHLTC